MAAKPVLQGCVRERVHPHAQGNLITAVNTPHAVLIAIGRFGFGLQHQVVTQPDNNDLRGISITPSTCCAGRWRMAAGGYLALLPAVLRHEAVVRPCAPPS